MAGIGEASAIIAVAQIGITLSKTIFEFATEIRDAPKAICRIGRDICTTSERLEEVGRLIEKNNTTQLFSETGIASAVRCSKDCKDIIADVSKVLAKGGWVPGSAALDKKDLDISLFETLRWPFVKTQLVGPQADLEKVKASLSLLFNSAMANASSNPLQSEYALQIPRLKKWAEQATRKAESSKRRMNNVDSKGERSLRREVLWEDEKGEEDAEILQKFVEYQARLIKEGEERKAQERAALIQAEKVKQQRAEEAVRQEIEQNAINNYKREQDEIKTLNLERENLLKEGLARLNVEPEKIESIIQFPYLQVSAWGSADKDRPSNKSIVPSSGEPEGIKAESGQSFEAASMAPNKTRSNLSWLSWIYAKNTRKTPSGLHEAPINSSNFESNYGFYPTYNTELWLIDLLSGQKTELQPSRAWLRSKMENQRHQNISHKLAQLKQPWRNLILDFLQIRNDNEASNKKWKLLFIGLPRRVPKMALFGHRHGGCLVQLIVCQKDDTNGAGISPPESLYSEPHVSDSSTSTHPNAKFSPKSMKDSPAQGLKGSFKRSNGLHAKDEDQGRKLDTKNVSFADDAVHPKLRNLDATVIIEQEEIEGDPEFLKGSTLILKDDQLEELIQVTKSKILDGKAPWIKLPEMFVTKYLHEYKSLEKGLPKNGEPETRAVNMSGTKYGLPIEREVEDDRNGERLSHRSLGTAVDVSKRQRAVDYGNPEPITVRSRSMPSRRNSRLDLVYNPDRVTQTLQNRAPRRGRYDIQIDRETSPERSRVRPEIIQYHDAEEIIYRPRNRDQREFSDERGNWRTRREESDDVPETFIPEEGRFQSLQRPGNENFETGTLTFTRRSERRESPPNRSYSSSDEKRAGALVLRKASPVSRHPYGRKSASREHVYLEQQDDNQSRRLRRSMSRRLSRSRSGFRTTAIRDHYLDRDSDSERHASPLRPNRSALKNDTRDEEIIATTLRNFTTFNSDADIDLMLSPAQIESSGLSDNDESKCSRTLEQATRKLDDLYAKLDVAIKDQDFITASDLKFYAIPDVKAEVQELKVRRAQKSQGRGVAWGEDAKVYEILEENEESEIDKLRKIEEGILNVPLPKETAIRADKSNENSNNQTNQGKKEFFPNTGSNKSNTGTHKPTITRTERFRTPSQTAKLEPQPEESNDVPDNELNRIIRRRVTVEDEMEPTQD